MRIAVVLLSVIAGSLLLTTAGAVLALFVLANPASGAEVFGGKIWQATSLVGVVAALAASGGVLLGWVVRGAPPTSPPVSTSSSQGATNGGLIAGLGPRARLVAIGLIFALCLALTLSGAALGQTTMPRALLLAVFATIAFAAMLTTIDALRDDPLELQSSWGGLGGGLGGWRLSRSAVLLLVSVAFAGAAAMVATPAAKTETRPRETASTGRSLTLTLSLSAPAAASVTTPAETPTPPGTD